MNKDAYNDNLTSTIWKND